MNNKRPKTIISGITYIEIVKILNKNDLYLKSQLSPKQSQEIYFYDKEIKDRILQTTARIINKVTYTTKGGQTNESSKNVMVKPITYGSKKKDNINDKPKESRRIYIPNNRRKLTLFKGQ